MRRPPKASGTASGGQGRRVQRYICLAYAALLAYVSLAPGQRVPGILDWSDLFSPDKVAHFLAYALFALLILLGLGGDSPGKRILLAVVIAAAYGALMEVLQGTMGFGREFDLVDMVANLIGAVLGGVVGWPLLRIRNKVSLRRGANDNF